MYTVTLCEAKFKSCSTLGSIIYMYVLLDWLFKLAPNGLFPQALHALGDGSPSHMEERTMEAVESLYNDPHPDVKKKARRMMKAYRRNGKWNIL